MSRTTIVSLEQGADSPFPSTVRKLAGALGVHELGRMECGASATTGNPPHDCLLERGPGVIFADCRYYGEFVAYSTELPLSWWPSR